MTLQYCSDLHLEFPQNRKFISKHAIKPIGDVLLLAGDIVPFVVMDEYDDFFDYLSDNFEKVYWVPGNHEYYHSDIINKDGFINEAIRSNVFLINNTTIQLDKLRLVFSTMWSNISPINYVSVQKRMADFSAIKCVDKAFTPNDYNELHQRCKNFIEQTLAQKTNASTIVVTHHIPTFLNYPAKYKRDVLNEAFAVELSNLIEQSEIDYWVYGHHHFNTLDFSIGKTQLLTNQLGYIKFKENRGYRNDAVIKMGG